MKTTDEIAKELMEGLGGLPSTLNPVWHVEYNELGDGPDTFLCAFLMDKDERIIAVDEDPEGIHEPPSPELEYLALCSPDNIKALLEEREAMKEGKPIDADAMDGRNIIAYFPLEGLSEDWPRFVAVRFSDGRWVHQGRACFGYSDMYQPTRWWPFPALNRIGDE